MRAYSVNTGTRGSIKRRITAILGAFALLTIWASLQAIAQTPMGIYVGQVWTAAQWNNWSATKQDFPIPVAAPLVVNPITGQLSCPTCATAGTVTYIFIDTRSGPVSQPLPIAAALDQSVLVKDKTGDATINNITVGTLDGSLIDGLATFVMEQNYSSHMFIWNGTGWSVY